MPAGRAGRLVAGVALARFVAACGHEWSGPGDVSDVDSGADDGVVPPDGADADGDADAAARGTLQSLVEDRRGINLKGSATTTELTLNEMMWLDPAVGVVPGDEKADPGNAIQLRAAAP
jgi:hypothetical protein